MLIAPALRSDVGVTLVLKLSNTHHPGRREVGLLQELLTFEVAVFEGDLADFKSHPATFQRRYRTGIQAAIFVFCTLHQKVHAVAVGDHGYLGCGVDVQMVAHIAQAP